MAIMGVDGQLPESGDGRRLLSSLVQLRCGPAAGARLLGVMSDRDFPLGSGVTDSLDPSVSEAEPGSAVRKAFFRAFAFAFLIT
jgi:hypothetical protein